MKRILCILLSAVFVFSFIACSETKPDTTPKVTTVADTTEAPVSDTVYYEPDELPDDLDFGGETVTILSPQANNGGFSFYETTFTVEELSNEVLNDSIYNRELYVEERLSVEINNAKVASTDREIEKIINAGDDTYDAIISTNTFLSECAIREWLLDLHEVKYLDFDKPWWSQNFVEEAEIFGRLYMATGAAFQSLIRSTYAAYYNKNLALDYVDSIPDLANLYGLVDDGRWTIDKFTEIGGQIYHDVNGNSIRDLEDIYGIAYTAIDAFWSGFDIEVFSRTDDGWFELSVNTDKMYSALDKIYRMLYEVDGSITANVGTAPDEVYNTYTNQEIYFANGTNLFLMERMGFAEKESLRNMQDDYGILPYPKYDENQTDYYSFVATSFGAVAIPTFNTDTDMIGAVLEAMASYSYRETRPLYLDVMLKGQYMSDPESREMVDIVIDGIMIDAAYIYVDTLANKYPTKFQQEIAEGGRSFATVHEANRKKVETVLKTYKKQFEK